MNQTSSIVATRGLRVGEYVLDEKIGQGAFGEVWKAYHKAWTNELAAVKIPTDAAFVRHLQSEGFSLNRLAHPNIVRVIGFDPTGTPPYMISELVDGPSLRELLARGSLPPAHAVAIVKQVLAGLAYAHGRGVIHGDVKPGNILVQKNAHASGYTAEGCVKLADFGVGLISAAAMLGGAASSSVLRGDRTSAVATLAYLAPEQRDGAPPDARCDLYACGVILFELLTGERPAGAESPSEINSAVPMTLDVVFRRAYARRDRRFATAQEFLSALDGGATIPSPIALKHEEDFVIGIRADDEPEAEYQSLPKGDIAEPVEIPPAPIVQEPAPPPPAAPVALSPEQTPAPIPETHPEPVEMPRPVARPTATRGIIVIDEMARRPLRTADDLRNLFRKVYLNRQLDDAEVANLRLRLDQWAEAAGGLPGFSERIDVLEALDCPYYRVLIRTDYEANPGATESSVNEGAVMLANPSAARDCGQAIQLSDFSLLLHLSSGSFPNILLELMPVPVIRMAVANLLTAAKVQAHGRAIARQELKLMRANVLSMRYNLDSAEQGVCFAGNGLKVVAPLTPVTKMRDDLLKRAAALLDSENIGAGMNELRQMFETANAAQPRAEQMLVALRAKLSAAYMKLADSTCGAFGIFESLGYSDRAAELQPSNRQVTNHEQRVRKLAFWVQSTPGMMIGIVFALIAAYNRPLHVGYVAAAFGAVITGILCWAFLRIRTARTDVAFVHSCILPLAVAAILATFIVDQGMPKEKVYSYSETAALLIVVAIAEKWLFNNYGAWLTRQNFRNNLVGTPLDILNQIQTMIDPDWPRLREYYVELGPLYKHASAKLGMEDSIGPTPSAEPPADLDDL